MTARPPDRPAGAGSLLASLFALLLVELTACGGAAAPPRKQVTEAPPPQVSGESIVAPVLRWPPLGYMTGSPHASQDGPSASLRPHFRWEPAQGAARYELELTAECDRRGFRDCEFGDAIRRQETDQTDLRSDQPLEVSATPPVGRRYYWRVRACHDDGCSDWSQIRYVDVGRLLGDLDGDGYEDVAVSDLGFSPSGQTARVGRSYVYEGNPSGLAMRPVATIPAPERGEYGPEFFGSVVQAGDIDGDGFSDLLIHYSGHASSAIILHGAASLSVPRITRITAPDGSQFWTALGAGDIDGDGYADVAFGSEVQGDHRRAVCVHFGDDDGPLGERVCHPAPEISGPPIRLVGSELASGDFDGDGYRDLAATFRQCTLDHLAIYRGGQGREPRHADAVIRHPESDSFAYLRGEACPGAELTDEEREYLMNTAAQFEEGLMETGEPPPPEFLFGYCGGSDCLGASDVDGDGLTDLLVGAPRFRALRPDDPDGRASRVRVLYGDRTQLGARRTELTSGDPRTGLTMAAWGRDLDADGIADFVGVRTGGAEVQLAVYWGSASGPERRGDDLLPGRSWVVGLADVRGDGRARLLVACTVDDDCGLESRSPAGDVVRRIPPPREFRGRDEAERIPLGF